MEQKIKALIQSGEPRAVANMVVALFDRQVEDEKNTNHTNHTNARGFNKPDARQCTLIAKHAKKRRHFGRDVFKLHPWMITDLQKRLPKYAKQLAEIMQEADYKPMIPKGL